MTALIEEVETARPIIHRTFGQGHGAITRLVSPHRVGNLIKPFVFLDLFDTRVGKFSGFGLHPHSGIATLTYVAEGNVSYEDTNGARGIVESGGLEWMRSGRGVWHGGGPGHSRLTRGFQLWVALPPHLELGPSVSIYRSADNLPASEPARVLLGKYEGLGGAIEAPSEMNYLAIRLRAGEHWQYQPPTGHSTLWVAVGKGAILTPELIRRGELAVFAPGQDPIDFVAKSETEFVLGSAPLHPHELVTGRYSVHTSEAALAAGERRIREIYVELVRTGRL